MDVIRWERHPRLRQPIVLAAFEGWNDAGEAASGALAYLARAWNATPFARVDGEEFFDFTVVRPEVRRDRRQGRHIEWPAIELSSATLPGAVDDVVFVTGPEPQLHWRSFTAGLVEATAALDARMVVTLGSLLADVAHTRPVRVTGTAGEHGPGEHLGHDRSRYQGPTGILGVLQDAFDRAGLPTASLWASVPHYVSQSPSPKATLALVERASAVLGATIDLTELEIASAAYERQVDELVAADEDALAYVSRLEEEGEDEMDEELGDELAPGLGWLGGTGPAGSAAPLELDPGATDALADEVARFLRQHGSD